MTRVVSNVAELDALPLPTILSAGPHDDWHKRRDGRWLSDGGDILSAADLLRLRGELVLTEPPVPGAWCAPANVAAGRADPVSDRERAIVSGMRRDFERKYGRSVALAKGARVIPERISEADPTATHGPARVEPLRESIGRALHAVDMSTTFLGPDSQPWEQVNQEYYLTRADAVLAALPGPTDSQIKREAISDARVVISQYLSTAEKWRYDRVMWAFAIMLGEIPEDTPEPAKQ